jgi:pantothenate kinase type III
MAILSDINFRYALNYSQTICADFGNSRAKFLLADGSYSILDYNSCFNSSLAKLLRHINTLVYSSVNKKIAKFLITDFSGKTLIDASLLLKKQSIIDYSAITGMGSDRLIGLLGSIAYATPPNITIDFGTATTINVIDKNNTVLGGMILPGISLQENSLRSNTSGLKKWSLNPESPLLGTNTSDAISSGILNGSAMAVSSAVRSIIKQYFNGGKANIFLTGGHLSLILPLLDLPAPSFNEQFLVLDGLKYLMDNTL